MAKKRLFQMFVGRESQAGVLFPSLIAAANAKIQVKDPKFTFDVEQYEREIVRGSIDPLTSISGIVEATATFSVELSGSSLSPATGNVPVWAPLLEACGFEQVAIKRVGLNATFTGSGDNPKVFEHGELVNGGTTSSVGRVIGDHWEGQSVLRYELVSGTGLTLAEDKTGATNGAVSSAGGGAANATEGLAWRPYSHPELTLDYASITGTVNAGDVLVGATSGAILTPVANLSAGPLTTIAFRILDGIVTSGETFNNTTQTGTVVNVTNIAQSKIPTLSMALIEDGRLKVFKACRGTVTFTGEIGKPVFMNFTFKGQLSSVGSAAQISGVSYESPVPPKFMGVEFKLGSYVSGEAGYNTYTTEHTPRITSFSLDVGNEVNLQKDATQSTGVLAAHLTGVRKARGSFNPEVRPEAVMPLLAHFRDGVPLRARMKVGTANKNRFFFMMKGVKPTQNGDGDRDGFATDELSFDLSSYRWNGADGDASSLVLVYSEGGVNAF